LKKSKRQIERAELLKKRQIKRAKLQKIKWIRERKKNPALRLIDNIEMESIFTGIENAYYSAIEQHKKYCIKNKIRPHNYMPGCCNIAGDIDMAAVYILNLLNQLKDEKRGKDWTKIRPSMMTDLFMIMHIINTTFVGNDFKLLNNQLDFESSQAIKNFQNEYYENMYLLDQAKEKKNPREDSQYI